MIKKLFKIGGTIIGTLIGITIFGIPSLIAIIFASLGKIEHVVMRYDSIEDAVFIKIAEWIMKHTVKMLDKFKEQLED